MLGLLRLRALLILVVSLPVMAFGLWQTYQGLYLYYFSVPCLATIIETEFKTDYAGKPAYVAYFQYTTVGGKTETGVENVDEAFYNANRSGGGTFPIAYLSEDSSQYVDDPGRVEIGIGLGLVESAIGYLIFSLGRSKLWPSTRDQTGEKPGEKSSLNWGKKSA